MQTRKRKGNLFMVDSKRIPALQIAKSIEPDKTAFTISRSKLADMLSMVKRTSSGYLSENSVGLSRYVLTASCVLGFPARALWDRIVEEVMSRDTGILFSLRVDELNDTDLALRELQEVILYHYFPAGFDMVMLLGECRFRSNVLTVTLDARLVNSLRSHLE